MSRAQFDLEIANRLIAAELATEFEDLTLEAEAIEDPEERGIAAEKILRAFKERFREMKLR